MQQENWSSEQLKFLLRTQPSGEQFMLYVCQISSILILIVPIQKEFPQGTTIETVEAFFAPHGRVQSVRLRKKADKAFKVRIKCKIIHYIHSVL